MRRSLIGIALLVALVAVGAASAAYPGKNGRLLFFRTGDVADLDANPAEIWTVDPDGSRLGRLTVADADRGGVGVDSARWSPDGSSIAYATDCGNRYDNHCGVLRTMRADGHDKRTVDRPVDPYNNSVGRDRFPTWSPDGARIAFERAWPNPDSVWEVNAVGGGAAQLVPRPLTEPAWSPDGTRFAFSSGNTIGIVDVDGGDERILAQNAYPYQPDWSPDGNWIAFGQLRQRIVWVCVVPAAGGAVRCLTHGDEAAWSPDGKQLVFVHGHDIWTIRADATHPRNVTRTPLRWESNPDWQPR